jgi:hypothetical protein
MFAQCSHFTTGGFERRNQKTIFLFLYLCAELVISNARLLHLGHLIIRQSKNIAVMPPTQRENGTIKAGALRNSLR